LARENQWSGDHVLNGLEMALNETFMILYILVIQHYTIISHEWGIGKPFANITTCIIMRTLVDLL
jgi:hypothetical protein